LGESQKKGPKKAGRRGDVYGKREPMNERV